MVSIKDVAKRANVSVSTVSNALNGKANVSDETRKRIMEIISEMNYYPNSMARNLKVKKTNTIAFCFSEFDRSFYLKIVRGINDCLVNYGYDLIICTYHSIERFLRTGFVDGALVLDRRVTDDLIKSISNEKLPIVVLDRELEGDNIYSVIVDNYSVMQEMVRGLIGKGYKRFSYITGVEKTKDNIERYQGMVDMLAEHEIKFLPKNYFHGDFTEKSGYQAARIMVVSQDLPEVVICANDDMAIGAIKAFREAGIKVPQEVAVTGFDDIDLASLMEPKLTTIAIPQYEWGMYAATVLFRVLDEYEVDFKPNKITANIKWRDTVM